MKIDQLIIPNLESVHTKSSIQSDGASGRDKSFSDMLLESVEKVNALQKQADMAINELIIGNNKDIVGTMIMMEKADISFRLMMQIRNKIIQAYEEIMRMQL